VEPLRAKPVWPKWSASSDLDRRITVDQLCHPITCEALEYWNKKKGARLLPLIADFNPADVPRSLPLLIVVDVVGDPREFRYAIVGEAQKQTTGLNLTGHTTAILDQNGGNIRQNVERMYNQVCDQKLPAASGGCLPLADRAFYQYECIHLPFSRQGDTVDRIIAVGVMELFNSFPSL
jgi:hypothetical protein